MRPGSFRRLAFPVTSLVLLASCSEKSLTDPPESPVIDSGAGVVGTKGGVIAVGSTASPAYGSMLIIPAGALAKPVEIRISAASGVSLPGDPTAVVVRFEPAGLQFQAPVALGLSYATRGAVNPAALKIVHYDPDKGSTTDLTSVSVDAQTQTLYAATDHFSYFALTSAGGGGPSAGDFVLVQPGSFRMGASSDNPDERPEHTVNITRAFYMQKTEVTQAQWTAVMGSNPSRFRSCGGDCPVESVSWNGVQTFITKLNQENPGAKYRLPTEAEWEYAARAGASGDYTGNGSVDAMGWHSGNSGGTTHPVAKKLANAWGLYDVQGNVMEWVQDWYSASYYSVSPSNDPQGPATGSVRVLRGGSALGGTAAHHMAFRGWDYPSTVHEGYGFRLARTP